MRARPWISWLLAIGVLTWMWMPFFLTVVHDLPFGSHSWKQGDCFALAQRYLEDGNWNILVPRTQSLIPTDGRVNAELPVVPYLAAVGARLAGKSRLEEIYRSLTLLFTAMAPLGIFGLMWGRTRRFPEALLAMVFLASCPILVYYATGFHPDPAAFGPLILGLTLVLGWRSSTIPGERTVAAGIGLMTLAGLMKMSMAPYLLVPAVLVLHRARRGRPGADAVDVLKRLPSAPVRALGAGAVLLVLQFVALWILAQGYAPTFFTASPHPFRSLGHLSAVMQQAWSVWMVYLFSVPQLWVLGLGVGLSVVRCFRGHNSTELGAATASAALVMVSLFILFGQQFAWHDYYAIANLYPAAALVTVRLSLAVARRRAVLRTWAARAIVGLALLGLAASMARNVGPLCERRTTRWWRRQVAWLDDGRSVLETCGPQCAGPVAVLGSTPPNLALTHLDRQGYVLGVTLREGLGVPCFGDLARLAAYLDARGAKVLLVKKQTLESLPENRVARWFERVGEKGDAVILVRKSKSAQENGRRQVPDSARGFMAPSSGDQRMVFV